MNTTTTTEHHHSAITTPRPAVLRRTAAIASLLAAGLLAGCYAQPTAAPDPSVTVPADQIALPVADPGSPAPEASTALPTTTSSTAVAPADAPVTSEPTPAETAADLGTAATASAKPKKTGHQIVRIMTGKDPLPSGFKAWAKERKLTYFFNNWMFDDGRGYYQKSKGDGCSTPIGKADMDRLYVSMCRGHDFGYELWRYFVDKGFYVDSKETIDAWLGDTIYAYCRQSVKSSKASCVYVSTVIRNATARFGHR